MQMGEKLTKGELGQKYMGSFLYCTYYATLW